MIHRARKIMLSLGVFAAMSTPLHAQDVNVRVLGCYPNKPQTEEFERPFYENLAEKTGLDIQAQYRSLGELNLKPFEHLRTLSSGAFDVMILGAGWVSGDDPTFVGHDLPGMAFDFDDVEAVMEAWRPVLAKRLAEAHNAKLLTMAPFPPQVLFCSDEVASLEDLRSKKIRVASAASANLVEAFGGTAVTLAGPEVYGALQRGVIDCGSTGTAYANANSWFEVSKSMYMLPIGGYSIVMHVARADFWNALDPEQQEKLEAAFAEMEAGIVEATKESHESGLRCNIGEEPCDGKLGSMTLVEVSEEDRQVVRETFEETVLPAWLEDCERVVADCRDQWDETVGQVIGLRK